MRVDQFPTASSIINEMREVERAIADFEAIKTDVSCLNIQTKEAWQQVGYQHLPQNTFKDFKDRCLTHLRTKLGHLKHQFESL